MSEQNKTKTVDVDMVDQALDLELVEAKTSNQMVEVNITGDVSETKLADLNPDEQQRVREIVNAIDITDSQGVLQFGNQAQTNISQFSDSILNKVKGKDTGYVGEILSDLMVNVKELDVDDLGKKNGVLGIFGGMKRNAMKFVAKYEKLSSHIDKTVQELDKSKMQLLKDITILDTLYDKNLEYHNELELFIVAGEEKINEIETKILPKMVEEARASNDPVEAQKVNDYQQLLNRFEKKVHDLKLSKMISLQTGPQIRLIQNSDQILVEKIQSSIMNTIPLWKNQVVIAISLFRQNKALAQQKEVTKATNDLLRQNSELLKQNTIEVAKESEKGIVEIDTLKKVNQDLLDTIDETISIQKEGREKRKLAEEELISMENQLKDKLLHARD